MKSGKELKVSDFNLTFGKNDMIVNVFACFKESKYGNQYIIYADPTEYKYGILRYGTLHVKDKSLVVLDVKDSKIEEIIKAFAWKVINNGDLTDYEIIDISNVEKIEPISYNRIDIKPELMLELDKLINRPVKVVEEDIDNKPKKKRKKSILITLIVFIALGVGGYFFYTNQDLFLGSEKFIVCKSTYDFNELNTKIEEEKTFYYNRKVELYEVVTNKVYTFYKKEEYVEFVKNALYYKYQGSGESKYSLDEENGIYKTFSKEVVDIEYINLNETEYDEVLSSYKKKGYKCEQKIESE